MNEIKIGDIVSKKSGKPFKNKELNDEVMEILENPYNPSKTLAARLKNSDTIVSLDLLKK
jgi:hypothetical protein